MQQFQGSRKCEASKAAKGGVDCTLSAGRTGIRIVGATDGTEASRTNGLSGTGFYIDSVDPEMDVRVYIAEDKRLTVHVTRKKDIEGDISSTCPWDDADITLDARATSGGPFGDAARK